MKFFLVVAMLFFAVNRAGASVQILPFTAFQDAQYAQSVPRTNNHALFHAVFLPSESEKADKLALSAISLGLFSLVFFWVAYVLFLLGIANSAILLLCLLSVLTGFIGIICGISLLFTKKKKGLQIVGAILGIISGLIGFFGSRKIFPEYN